MDIDIRTLLGRLNPECKRAMEQAAELCVQQTHYNVDIEHLLMKLVDNEAPDLRLVFGRFGIRPTRCRRSFRSRSTPSSAATAARPASRPTSRRSSRKPGS